MRRFVLLILGSFVLAVAATAAAFAFAWRRNRRLGSGFTNRVVDPILIRLGVVGGRRSELGLIEHVGRTSGIRRLTPVHPEPIPDGFRIVVPLAEASEWARNVLAAGRCRLQVHGVVYELAEPSLVPAGTVDDLPRPVRQLLAAAGFDYLVMKTRSAEIGTFESVAAPSEKEGVPALPTAA